jgi:NADH dehydrogenase FAD-containing subunit
MFGERALLPSSGRRDPDSAIIHGPHVISTASGRRVDSDLTLICVGIGTCNTQMLHCDYLTAAGQVKVRKTLQVHSHDHIFSLGDVADTGAQKSILPIYAQAKIVAANVVAMITGHALKTYTPSPEKTLSITLTPNEAIGQIPYLPAFLADFLFSLIKARHLILELVYPSYRQKLSWF